jgi:hypothetical protein
MAVNFGAGMDSLLQLNWFASGQSILIDSSLVRDRRMVALPHISPAHSNQLRASLSQPAEME